ncbi:MAG: ethanolamine ammonia-lyase light chain EutC [Gemmataceae bacterium]
MERDLGSDLVRQFQLFEARTRAGSKEEYLLRPDLGRRLDDASRQLIGKERWPWSNRCVGSKRVAWPSRRNWPTMTPPHPFPLSPAGRGERGEGNRIAPSARVNRLRQIISQGALQFGHAGHQASPTAAR